MFMDGHRMGIPTFPKDWDVSFKLYAPDNYVVSGSYKADRWSEKPSLVKKQK